MSDGMTYMTREKGIDEFYKQKLYTIRRGCLVVSRDGSRINLFDLLANEHVGPPTVLSNNIIRVQTVIIGSGLEELYTKTLSGVKTNA